MKTLRQYLHEILFLLGDDKPKIVGLFFLFLASSMLDLAGLGLIGPYIALVINTDSVLKIKIENALADLGFVVEPELLIIYIGACLLFIFLFKTVAAIFINARILRFGWNQQTKLRSSLMRSYQQMPYADYLMRNSSEYIQTILGMVAQFISSVLLPGLRILCEGTVGIVVLALLAWTNGSALALLAFLLGLVMVLYDLIIKRRVRSYGEWANVGATRLVKGIHEGINGFKEIRILGKPDYFHKIVEQGAAENANNQVKVQILSTAPRYLLEFVIIAFIVLLIFGVLVLGGDLKTLIPTLGVFGVAALRLTPSVNVMINGFIQIRYGRYATARIYNDMQNLAAYNSQKQFTQNNTSVAEPFKQLIVKGVNFRYQNSSQWALVDFSISIEAGESIGIIGSSGAGKTTLLDVLLGLLEPQEGMILYNGRKINETISNWRSQVAYLPQDVFLIDNSLRCNIALGQNEDEIDDEMVNEAIKQARLSDLVKQLPKGIDTLVGEKGVRLSGGQRQRVALARAFYHGRNVLVMDEATSSLDQTTEHEIVEEIKNLKRKKTLVVIAHRLSTVSHCDRIYKLDNGRIIKTGSYEEVVQNRLQQ